jgi:hypothetical protein
MSLQRGQVWSKARCLSRADVTFLVRSGDGQHASWVSFDELERRGDTPTAAQVMMRPCKKLRYHGGKTGDKCCFFPKVVLFFSIRI